MPKVTPTLSNYSQPAAIRRELVNIASSDIEKAMAAISRLDTIANSDKVLFLLFLKTFIIMCIQVFL